MTLFNDNEFKPTVKLIKVFWNKQLVLGLVAALEKLLEVTTKLQREFCKSLYKQPFKSSTFYQFNLLDKKT